MNATVKKPANHVLHLILSVITFGMWLPVWAVCAAVGRKETTRTQGGWEYGWDRNYGHVPQQIEPRHDWAMGPPQPAWTEAQQQAGGWQWNPYANWWDPLAYPKELRRG